MLLLTGGTGSLGRGFIAHSGYKGRIRVLSRDEQKHERLREVLPADAGVQLVLGDVRDRHKLSLACRDVDVVVHAAALKIIPNGDYNPDEMIRTNVMGTMNVIEEAIAAGARKVMVVSTDKSCTPSTLYGATKMCAEHYAVHANKWSRNTDVSCVRYGNVIDSRGSFTKRLREAEEDPSVVLKITDLECTRFWITLPQAVRFIDDMLSIMEGGEIFVPRLPSERLGDMIPKGASFEVVGLRQTEKLHEDLIGLHEIPHTDVYEGYFIVRRWPHKGNCLERLPYRSNSDERWGLDRVPVGEREADTQVPADGEPGREPSGASLPPRGHGEETE